MPRDCGSCGLDPELVPLGLAGKQSVERLVDGLAPAITKQVSELDFLVMAKTAIDGAGGSDADSIASFAEVVRERRDQPKAGAESVNLEIARRPSSARQRRHQVELSLQGGPDFAQWQVMLGAVLLDLAERHGLDQRQG